ncbi:hypothetical protein PIB30_080911, partial [Stylosanthes scabra]|nr:hypothetical protein [Stylosanthes scabra]
MFSFITIHYTVSLGFRGVKRTRCSTYGNNGPSGVVSVYGGICFHVGQRLTSRLTVAAGGPPANVPATNLGYSREKRREPPIIYDYEMRDRLRSRPA